MVVVLAALWSPLGVRAEHPPSLAAAVSSPARSSSDFDADGYADLALGVPRENVAGVHDVGAVNVLFGSRSGLTADENQLRHQDSVGVPGEGESSDLWGYALAAGDFDGNGFADLAVGAPFEDVGSIVNAGAVTVLFGSAHGLTSSGSQLWNQGSPEVPNVPEAGDQFGSSLAVGDLNGDGYADLAVGVPREDFLGVANSGIVQLLLGSPLGLTPARPGSFSQGRRVADEPERGDQFGKTLASGDLNGDGFGDVAVGAPSENFTPKGEEGIVNVLYGSALGLTVDGDQRITQNSPGMGDAAEPGDGFGGTIATGDIDHDGHDDLVIGAFLEDVSGAGDAGAVNVLMGSSSGVFPADRPFWHQDSTGVPGTAGTADDFGKALALGDLNGDGFADVAVAARYDDEAGPPASGAVDILYGSAVGLSARGAQLWTQDSTGVPDAAEERDHFGSVLAIAHLGSEPAAHLAIGVHFEAIGDAPLAGAMTVLRGSTVGVTAEGAQFWTQDTPGVLERVDSNDFFPFSMAGSG